MMTSTQIRQSFLDFFKSKQHTIVPSSSLMPDSPNLLFTNAGMNQFVPIFLGQTKCPYAPGRAADTQKCIRAGGKHNDLDDVGLDTYHHTFFEMLGNWSFGDYFKKEAIEWAWELVVGIWKFPPQRLYATVYNPDKSQNDPSEFDQEAWNFWAEKFRSVGLDPAVHIVNGNKKDNFWMMGETGPCGPCSELHMDLTPAGDTKGALVNKGDARCIEIWNLVFIQFNAQPRGGSAPAADSATGASQPLIEFVPLAAQHVDTGMGFERVTSIIQGTKGLTDFVHAKISNYETDIFRPIFDALEKLSGKRYGSTLPAPVGQASSLSPTSKPGSGESNGDRLEACPTPEQIATDIAFRVIADHIRTLSFAIADGIQPGIKGRNGVLRGIHKRMVRYASTIGIKDELLLRTQDALVDTLAVAMGDVFAEIRREKEHIKNVLRGEADVFNRTLGAGLNVFETIINLRGRISDAPTSPAFVKTRANLDKFRGLHVQDADLANTKWFAEDFNSITGRYSFLPQDLREYSLITYAEIAERIREAIKKFGDFWHARMNAGIPKAEFLTRLDEMLRSIERESQQVGTTLSGEAAFLLHDTYGFPFDLTELMARERNLTVDKEGFNRLMDEQKKRSQAAQRKEVISLSQIETTSPTKFVGFDALETPAKVLEVVSLKDKTAVILDASSAYAEMGGQVGDTGELVVAADGSQPQISSGSANMAAFSRTPLRITNTQKSGNTWLHFVEGDDIPATGDNVVLRVDKSRRDAIQRHHTVTHLLHWALHEAVSKEASQKGSFVGPDKLTFDFNSAPLTPAQVADIEKLVNERILENASVSWTEVAYADVKSRKDVMQFFGDKYGDTVRVVQIGGAAQRLDGYSMELCGGTHTRATGEIGLFRIVGENAIAAGVRRIEAVAGLTAYDVMKSDRELIRAVAVKVSSPIHELEKKIESLLAQQKKLEKEVQIALQRNASNAASELLERIHAVNDIPFISHNLGDADADFLQATADALKGRFKGVVVLGGCGNNAVTLIATVSPEFTAKIQAGKIIQQIAPIVGGKGGGKPDNARGGGKDPSKLDEALAKARSLLG